jgi:hypothetical protein
MMNGPIASDDVAPTSTEIATMNHDHHSSNGLPFTATQGDEPNRVAQLQQETAIAHHIARTNEETYRKTLQFINEDICSVRRRRRDPELTAELNKLQQILRTWIARFDAKVRFAQVKTAIARLTANAGELIAALEYERDTYGERLPNELWYRTLKVLMPK